MTTMTTPDPSFYSSFYTFSDGSLSCYAPMKTVHVFFAYVVCISGFMCFVTRMVPSIKFLHAWCGRIYILAMFWATVCSLLIFNHGLPTGTIVSFVFVTCGLTLGWIIITIHQKLFFNHTLRRVEELLAYGEAPKDAPLKKVFEQAQVDICNKKTFFQRFVSLKTAHGVLMLISWINIAGRIFVTNPTEEFECWSYPMFKPINSPQFNEMVGAVPANSTGTGTCFPLPSENPNAASLPWNKTGLVGWGLALSLGPLFGGLIIAAIAAGLDVWRIKRASAKESALLDEPAEVQA